MPVPPDKSAEFEHLFTLTNRWRDAQKLAAHRRLLLDKAVANAITSTPKTPTWYLHPGKLTVEQACEATGLTPLAIHRLMERQYRKPGR